MNSIARGHCVDCPKWPIRGVEWKLAEFVAGLMGGGIIVDHKGERLGVYNFQVGYNGAAPVLENQTTSNETYFGHRRLAPLDRLGSARMVGSTKTSYYPYGEDKAGNPTTDAWKFGTYWRDSVSGLDYADQRFYSSQLSRFMTPDQSASPSLGMPKTWNRYTYAGDDPVNNVDLTGRAYVCADSGYDNAGGSSSPDCYWQYSADDGAGPPAPDVPGCEVINGFDPTPAPPDPACYGPGEASPAPVITGQECQIVVGYSIVNIAGLSTGKNHTTVTINTWTNWFTPTTPWGGRSPSRRRTQPLTKAPPTTPTRGIR